MISSFLINYYSFYTLIIDPDLCIKLLEESHLWNNLNEEKKSISDSELQV